MIVAIAKRVVIRNLPTSHGQHMYGQSCGCSLWLMAMYNVTGAGFVLPAWDSERHFVVQSQDPRTTVRWYMVVEVIDKGGIIPKWFTVPSLAVSWNFGITNFWNVIPSFPPFDKSNLRVLVARTWLDSCFDDIISRRIVDIRVTPFPQNIL